LSKYNLIGFVIIEPVLCEIAAVAVDNKKTPGSPTPRFLFRVAVKYLL